MIEPYYHDEKYGQTIYLGDCLDIMPQLEQVDLVCTDPQYGIGEAAGKNKSRGCLAVSKDYGNADWDNKPFDFDCLWTLLSMGKYACCFGGNYYPMPPSSCWLVWDKMNGDTDFADCELAWTNYPRAVRMKKHQWQGMLRKHHEARFHPTQKPLDIIKWAIQLSPKYDTILDPFMGSGTTLVAAKQLGRKCIGIEINEDYAKIAVRRLQQDVFQWEAKHENKSD